MTAVVVVEGVVIAVLALLVVGLLRSHAEILKRLHDLGVGLEGPPSPGRAAPTPAGVPCSARLPGDAAGAVAAGPWWGSPALPTSWGSPPGATRRCR